MKRVVWSRSALDDFRDALAYLANMEPAAAELVADRIDKVVSNLADFQTGRPGRVVGTYEKPVAGTSYVVAYAIHGHDVVVLRVIHDRRHWPEGEWPA